MPEAYANYLSYQMAGDPMECLLSVADGMSTLGILSPSSSSLDSQITSSASSPMSIAPSPTHPSSNYITLNNVTGTILEKPYLSLIEAPVEKFRFRYKSEMMGTHGSLSSSSSSSGRRKQAPTVELHNYIGSAIIRCSLVTADHTRRCPHVHRLVCRVGNEEKVDPHEITVSPEIGFQASFFGMGIIHTAKKHVMEEYIKKARNLALEEARRKNSKVTSLTIREEASLKIEATEAQKWMNLNSVALCFQAFTSDSYGVMNPLTDPIYSQPINNLKSALTGELKICRIDKITSSCEGGEEIFMLVEKVGKKNIKIKFFETNDEDKELWSAYGRFSELDVHHQYAIVFRTPPYKNTEITSPVEVFIQLERPTDGDCSEAITFTYKPSERISCRKRLRTHYESNSDDLIPLPIMMSGINATPCHPLEMNNQTLSNISAEIYKLLTDACPSDDLKQVVENIDLDDYLQTLPDPSPTLTVDGPSTKEQDGLHFARDILQQIRAVLIKDPQQINQQVVELLKERTVYGDTPIHAALRLNQRALVNRILMLIAECKERETIVDAQNSSGKTCLHYAVMRNQPVVTEALLYLGANPNACDDNGFSPLHVAVQQLDAGACVDALLQQKNISIETRNDAGWTAFHLAAEAGSLHAIKSLVKAKVDVNGTDTSFGRTALHIAVEGGHKDVVEFLLTETNIDPNKRNFSGNTALHSAVVNTGTRAKELCELLLKYGANPRISNFDRESGKESRATTVKTEAESEDDDNECVDVEQNGQTSFDLASDKPEILELLTSNNTEESVEMPLVTEVKKEMDEQCDSDGLFDDETVLLLVAILDKSKGWKKLAMSLNYGYMLPALERSNIGPTRMLFNYIDLQPNLNADKVRNILEEINENKAVQIIDEMIARRRE